MKFGAMKPSDAVGGVTVHSIRQNGLVLKKGTWSALPKSRRWRRPA